MKKIISSLLTVIILTGCAFSISCFAYGENNKVEDQMVIKGPTISVPFSANKEVAVTTNNLSEKKSNTSTNIKVDVELFNLALERVKAIKDQYKGASKMTTRSIINQEIDVINKKLNNISRIEKEEKNKEEIVQEIKFLEFQKELLKSEKTLNGFIDLKTTSYITLASAAVTLALPFIIPYLTMTSYVAIASAAATLAFTYLA